MENMDKLSEKKVEELKQEIKARLSDNYDEKENEEEKVSCEEIADEIRNIGTEEELHEYLEEHHDVDIAESFEEFENDEDILRILNALDYEEKANVIEEADEKIQKKIVEILPEDEVIEIFSHMSPDDIVDILGYINFQKRKSLLDSMKRSDANKLRELLGYETDSAGGIMTTQFIAFKKNLKMKDILEKIKIIGPKTEYIETIFVLDENGALIGEADLRDVLCSSDDTLLSEITEENFKYVNPKDDQEEVALLVSKYSLKVVPVVSDKMALMGIITIDDVVDVIQEEHTEDMLKLAGTGDDEDIYTSLYESTKKRLPWLLINLLTAFLASFTVGLFQNTIDKVVALSVTMPIVSGMGGNAGTQALAVTIRSIALGEYDGNDNLEISIKYIVLGFINGLLIGIVCALIISLAFQNIYLGVVILLSMIGNCIIACLVGYLIPIGLQAMNIDPAMASAVILTTVTDVCGFFLFLGLATMFITKL